MNGLLATNGTMPSSSYRAAFSPPIHSSTTTSPARVTATPTLSARAASSNSFVTLSTARPPKHLAGARPSRAAPGVRCILPRRRGCGNGRRPRRHGRIAAADGRLVGAEERRREAGRSLEEAAEVQLVVVAEAVGDLLDRQVRVQQLPAALLQDALADQPAERLAEVLADQPPQRLGRQVQPPGVVRRGVQGAVLGFQQLAQLAEDRGPRRSRAWTRFLLLQLEAAGPDQQDLQVRQQNLGVGQAALG